MSLILDGTNGITTNSGTAISASTIGVGGTTPASSGAGITFPATQSASTDANTLDDYEEGTWTPTDGSGAGLSISNGGCNYTKIGRFVMASGSITYPSTANGSNAKISGLPFTVGGAGMHSGSIGYTSYGTATTIDTNDSAVTFVFYAFGGSSVTNANLSTKRIDFAIYYQV